MELALDRNMLLKALDDFANFESIFEVVQAINCYNGNLDYLAFMSNDDEFFDVCFFNDPMGAVRVTQYGDYHYMDDYVLFNAYGNLDSYNDYEAMNEFREYKEEIANEIFELYDVDEYIRNIVENLIKGE